VRVGVGELDEVPEREGVKVKGAGEADVEAEVVVVEAAVH
jgi:hypothetical protein